MLSKSAPKSKKLTAEPQPAKLRTINDLTETVHSRIPEVVTAISSGRPMFLKLWKCPPGGLSQTDAEQLVNILRVVLETNDALRTECRHVSAYVKTVRELAGDVETAAAQARAKAWNLQKKVGEFKFTITDQEEGDDA